MWGRSLTGGAVGALLIGLAAGCGRATATAAAPTLTLPSLLAVTQAPQPTPTVTRGPAVPGKGDLVTFTIVYDNNAHDPALQTAWGFACLVEKGETALLFDTGGDGPTLLHNMASLGISPQAIDTVVLSHIHDDHTGGLGAVLDTGARPTVYVPRAFPSSFKNSVRSRTRLVEVTGPAEILPGAYTTGALGSEIIEQALAVEVAGGSVVVTGCAHPGIVEMLQRAKDVTGSEAVLVMGGFHLRRASRARIKGIIADFRQLGVRQLAPCHCTGDQARQMFADAFGADLVPAGAGWSITFNTVEEAE